MGAAATFAAASQPSTQPNATKQQSNSTGINVSNKSTTNFDLFATDGENLNSQQQQPSSLVITGDDDDFDPRGVGRYAYLIRQSIKYIISSFLNSDQILTF